jgi:hypothetical protein
MGKLMLGLVLCVAFGLPAKAMEPVLAVKTASLDHAAKHPACHSVSADRKLKLLRETIVQVEKNTPADRIVRRAAPQVNNRVAEPVVRAGRAAAVHFSRRAELVRFERPTSERVSLVVGIGY